jgi:hypothetical protein
MPSLRPSAARCANYGTAPQYFSLFLQNKADAKQEAKVAVHKNSQPFMPQNSAPWRAIPLRHGL